MTGKKNINIFDISPLVLFNSLRPQGRSSSEALLKTVRLLLPHLLDRLRPPGLHGRRYPNLLNSKLFLTIPPRKNFPITLFSHRYTLIITDIFFITTQVVRFRVHSSGVNRFAIFFIFLLFFSTFQFQVSSRERLHIILNVLISLYLNLSAFICVNLWLNSY